jgi:hypothetical protein
MATDLDDLRAKLRAAADVLTNRTILDEAAAVLSETASHDALMPAVINATSSLHEALSTQAAAWLRGVDDDELVPFEGGYEPIATQALHIGVDQVAVLQATRTHLEPPDPAMQFSMDDVVLSRLRGYSYSAQITDGTWIHFFRRLTRSSLQLERERGIVARFVDNQFDLVPERGLRLDTDFDAAVVGDDVVLRHRSNFERLFDFAQLTEAHAAASAAAVVDGLAIKGIDDFIRIVSADQRMHAKLSSALFKMQDADYKAKVTTESIATLVGIRSDVDLEIEGTDGDLQLVFDGSAQRRWTLLKILDDDYVISELTESRYQAPSKHRGSG